MAKHTTSVVLTSEYQLVSNGLATCIISCLNLGLVEIFVADDATGLTSADVGHAFNYAKNREPIILTGLGTKDVFAKTNADGDGVTKIAVTAF